MAENHNDEIEASVEEHGSYCALEVRSKRGTGTRNEDRVKATLARPTLDDVEGEKDQLIALVKESLGDAREFQPDADE
ncbi:DUF7389 domain-containing protein [Haloferax sulfurifontis]|uniref:DUF7389 domain-containing protein n=2 Tax=Haloferax sulfurifontis TaxID=255616 RepID=M0III0_9EURY|nr:hypothetical protein [Haloferax sulfurifontis]ELZ96550.1 hypothetical protein C441_04259 [Haloferax sulfurifontis ATCC BAA-897]GGC72195.1 hypothetical protein GCM10007209_37660 [Haloferax sulfurifontis]